MSNKKTLTPKQKRFCEEYIIDLNATQAAIRAGYSKKTAKEIGYENLTKLHVQDYIKELNSERQERTRITADQVLTELENTLMVRVLQLTLTPQKYFVTRTLLVLTLS